MSTSKHSTTGPAPRLVALIGNPNSGKTSIFNGLTGLRHKVGNYPGVTVERREGAMSGTSSTTLLDLPGCYSLSPRSLDERIARDVLLGWAKGVRRPDAVIVIVDASNLERNLFLTLQILELDLPTVVVCNMLDRVRARGDHIDLKQLEAKLGVPVVGTTATSGEGLDVLRSTVGAINGHDACKREWLDTDSIEPVVTPVLDLMRGHDIVDSSDGVGVALLMLSPAVLDQADSAYADVPEGFRRELAGFHETRDADETADLVSKVIQNRYQWLTHNVSDVLTENRVVTTSLSDRIDRVVTHKIGGMVVFSGMMLVMFLAIFSGAEPLMDGIDWLISTLGSAVASMLGEGTLTDLLVDGVIGGVGNVLVFFPQICILFLFVALLEDSGYMARVAFVMDKVMSGVGLHGKSFIPLLSSFACAVPAIMATRTIENQRDRLTTLLVAPLMSCSARLPIYLILISVLFAGSLWLKVAILFAMYALGTITALLVAMLLKRTILKGPTPSFLLELPPYRMPQFRAVVGHMWDRSKLFLTQAGGIILALSIVLWALAYFPRDTQSPDTDASAQLQQSYLGRIGQVMEPIIEPLGFDWKIGVGLTASFAAREVFVSTMGIVYGVGAGADEQSLPLRQRMGAAAWPDGRKVFTPLVGISLMVFYVLACQCMSTLAVVRRETNSWRWPIFMFTYMTALAYVASLIVYQGGTALGFG